MSSCARREPARHRWTRHCSRSSLGVSSRKQTMSIAAPKDRLTERLAYTDTGSGRPVVLLHGLTCNAAYWLRVRPLLESVRVFTLDFRGHGLSEPRDSYRYI